MRENVSYYQLGLSHILSLSLTSHPSIYACRAFFSTLVLRCLEDSDNHRRQERGPHTHLTGGILRVSLWRRFSCLAVAAVCVSRCGFIRSRAMAVKTDLWRRKKTTATAACCCRRGRCCFQDKKAVTARSQQLSPALPRSYSCACVCFMSRKHSVGSLALWLTPCDRERPDLYI